MFGFTAKDKCRCEDTFGKCVPCQLREHPIHKTQPETHTVLNQNARSPQDAAAMLEP